MTEAEWSQATDPGPLLGFLQATRVNWTKRGRRKLRLFGCGCGCRVWRLMSEQGRTWLNLGQQCAEGLLTSAERRRVESQDAWLFQEPSTAADPEAWRLQRTADTAAWFTLASNVMMAATVPAHSAAMVVGMAAVQRGRSGVEYEAEQKEQAVLLHDIFRNPFRPASIAPAWLSPTVRALAQAAYDDRSFPAGTLDTVRVAVLADALEEAGCTSADVLGHLRGPGPHVRGCWAVDLLLGKE